MRQSTYLNVILTVNAGLLTAMLWTHLVGGAGVPTLGNTAHAQSTPGFPNASEQRHRMIESLAEIKTSVEATRRLIETGRLKVEVTNIDKLRSDQK